MAALGLAYLRALARAAPAGDLARAVMRRLRRRARRPRTPGVDDLERALSAMSLAPRLFCDEDPRPLYQRFFPESIERFRVRARRILDGEAEIFGAWRRVDAPASDPKIEWEVARAGHLVELAAAARLHPDLAEPARAQIAAEIVRFLPLPGPPLEIAVRAIHARAACELARVDPDERTAFSLLQVGELLSTNLEDGGVCPANHLLGDWVGLLIIGGWIGRSDWVTRASAGIHREAARQVGDDGAHFEASTAYHRFALELLLVAERLGVAVRPTLARMLGFARGYLLPDGTHPGFGDGDDARVVPIVPRDPALHAPLVGLGAGLLGEPRPSGAPPEEVVWWGGAAGLDAFWAAPLATPVPAASFPSGGVHLLRSPSVVVAMRAGSYGQNGVGGHAHNDQLSLVIHARGQPLIVDSGTGSYTADPAVRDRFRGTAAHSTVIIDGEEQSPFFRERPFALPDAARTGPVRVEDLGERAAMWAAHSGYRRLRAGVRHARRVTLHRGLDALVIEDELDGSGAHSVALRFHLAGLARVGASEAARQRAAALEETLGPLDLARAVEVEGRALLVPLAGVGLSPEVGRGWLSPCFGKILRGPLVAWVGLLSLPQTLRVAVVLLG